MTRYHRAVLLFSVNPPFLLLQVILEYIIQNGRCADTGCIALWQLMEEKEVVQGATWASLKERFRRSILKRLDSFDLPEQARQQLRQGGHASAGLKSSSSTTPTSATTNASLSSSSTTEKAVLDSGTSSDDQPEVKLEPEVLVTVVPSISICPICLEKVNSRHMSRHRDQKHNNLLPPPCHLCGEQLGRIDTLGLHLKKRCTR